MVLCGALADAKIHGDLFTGGLSGENEFHDLALSRSETRELWAPTIFLFSIARGAEELDAHSLFSDHTQACRSNRIMPTNPANSAADSPMATRVAFTARSFSHQLVG